jgi:hypothetical protein
MCHESDICPIHLRHEIFKGCVNHNPKLFMSYYKTIYGVKMDGQLLDKANKAVAGARDGRISVDDAKSIILSVTDGGEYTPIEKLTMEYIRDNHQWTDAADSWFRSEIASWAATK